MTRQSQPTYQHQVAQLPVIAVVRNVRDMILSQRHQNRLREGGLARPTASRNSQNNRQVAPVEVGVHLLEDPSYEAGVVHHLHAKLIQHAALRIWAFWLASVQRV